MSSSISELRQQAFKILHDRSDSGWGIMLQQFLLWLIILNVLLGIITTVPAFETAKQTIFWFEIFSIIVFTVEYFARIWTATLHKETTGSRGVVKYMLSPLMLLDFCVIAPFYISLFLQADLQWIVIFRLMRIFRALRVVKYSAAFNRITEVIKKEKDELLAVLVMMVVMLLVSSTLLYMAEKDVPGTQFTSIPAAFWWGIATLTTIGYGDMVPITPLGKIFGSLAALVGVGLFALPTGLLGASFYQDVAKRRESQIRKMGKQIGMIKTYTEESGEKIEKFAETQKRKIQRLERELAQAKLELEERDAEDEEERR